MKNAFSLIDKFVYFAGFITVIASTLSILWKFITWIFGLSPVLYRLGISLWGRKIAIIGSPGFYKSIEKTIKDSKIFKKITHIDLENLINAKDETFLLLDWESCESIIDKIFSYRKNSQTPVIIYSKPGAIPKMTMSKIANQPSTTVVNFRGRLLNDILNSLITTSYGRK